MADEIPDRPVLVIVTGAPGAGKTSLARPLAERLRLPLVCKDDLKEILFEVLGWGGRDWSRKMSDAAYELMFHLAGLELSAGRSLMLEANFRSEAVPRLERLRRKHRVKLLQVGCFAEEEVVIQRLVRRSELKLRHPGHLDDQTLPQMRELAASKSFLDIDGAFIAVDTTDPQGIDVSAVARSIEALLVEAGEK